MLLGEPSFTWILTRGYFVVDTDARLMADRLFYIGYEIVYWYHHYEGLFLRRREYLVIRLQCHRGGLSHRVEVQEMGELWGHLIHHQAIWV